MASGADRISELPDSLLMDILSLLRMKHVARAYIFSRRWRDLCAEHMATRADLHFVGDFRRRHSPQQFVDKVNFYLERYSASNLKSLHLSVHLPKSCWQDLERWVEIAVRKGVEDLALDLTPNSEDEEDDYEDEDYEDLDEDGTWRHKLEIGNNAFSASPGFLRSISFTRCALSPDFDFVHLGSSLRCAYFKHLNLDSADVQKLVSACPTLECLHLWGCDPLDSVVIDGACGSRLTELVIANCDMLYEVSISTPCLRSFQFYGDMDFNIEFKDISSIEDALFNCVDRQADLDGNNPIMTLQAVYRARVLTLCHCTLEIVSMFGQDPDDLYHPVPLENLKELQLLLAVLNVRFLIYTFDFFRFCVMPVLEQIFIRLPIMSMYAAAHRMVDSPECQLDHLKVVKVTNFFGTHLELQLVMYFLEHAPVLEKLVLVASRAWSPDSPLAPDRVAVKERLDIQMSRALSPVVELVLCDYSKDSSGLHPTHLETYDSESYTK